MAGEPVNLDVKAQTAEATQQLITLEAQIDRLLAKAGLLPTVPGLPTSPSLNLRGSNLLSQRSVLPGLRLSTAFLHTAGLRTLPVSASIATPYNPEVWKSVGVTKPYSGVSVASSASLKKLDDLVVSSAAGVAGSKASAEMAARKPQFGSSPTNNKSFLSLKGGGLKAGPFGFGRAGFTFSSGALISRLGPAATKSFAAIFIAKGLSDLGNSTFPATLSALEQAEKENESYITVVNKRFRDKAQHTLATGRDTIGEMLKNFVVGTGRLVSDGTTTFVNVTQGQKAALAHARGADAKLKNTENFFENLLDLSGSQRRMDAAYRIHQRNKEDALKAAEQYADDHLQELADTLQGYGFPGTSRQIEKDVQDRNRGFFRKKVLEEFAKVESTPEILGAHLKGISSGDQGEGAN